MSQTINTTIGLAANATSPGQLVHFKSPHDTNVSITNNSGQSIQYAIDGATWVTVANGATASVGTVTAASQFRMRKTAGDSYPVPVAMSWTTVDSEFDPSSVAITGGTIRGCDINTGDFRAGQLLPKVMASPPTVGAASTSSVLTGAVVVDALEAGKFTFGGGSVYRGAVPPNGGNFPAYLGVILGNYPGTTSASPATIDFDIDSADATGRFELYFTGNGLKVRALVQSAAGVWEMVTASGPTWTLANDGSAYFLPLTMGAAGTYRIRLECTGGIKFRGVNCFATDTIRTTAKPRRRYIVVGDSFAEPTIVDSGASTPNDGWPQKLAYLTGLDLWSAGSGGTGYVNPNSGASRQKFRDRLATDVIPFAPDGVIFAGGINDISFATAAAVGVEAGLCFDQIRAALPNCDIVVLSPFNPASLTGSSVSNILAVRDAIQTAANARGLKFLDLLSLPVLDYLGSWSSTLSSSTAINATTISVPTLPDYFGYVNAGSDDFYVYIQDGANSEVRKASINSRGNPNVLSVSALTFAHSAGAVVTLAGPQYMTGTGKQGTTTGVGNADRYTGSDGTHPTVAGHAHIAYTTHSLWTKKLSTR